MAERSGLLNRRTLTRVPRVRIPVSPLETAREGSFRDVPRHLRGRYRPACKAQGIVIAPRLGRGGRHARGVTTLKRSLDVRLYFI